MRHACPVCGFLTLPARHDWEICAVCFWEDDLLDDGLGPSPANGGLTIALARANFAALGACDPATVSHVRPPRPEERPAAN